MRRENKRSEAVRKHLCTDRWLVVRTYRERTFNEQNLSDACYLVEANKPMNSMNRK